MSRTIKMIENGVKFNNLTVTKFLGTLETASSFAAFFECKCICGTFIKVRGADLRNGNSKSCGCTKKTTLGHRHNSNHASPTYNSWRSMKQRCLNPSSKNFDCWGGRGITICDTWLGKDGFKKFLADLGERPIGKTLDRIDNDKGYYAGNCRWATPSEQLKNRRASKQLRGVK